MTREDIFGKSAEIAIELLEKERGLQKLAEASLAKKIQDFVYESVVHSNTFLKVPMIVAGYAAFFQPRPRAANI